MKWKKQLHHVVSPARLFFHVFHVKDILSPLPLRVFWGFGGFYFCQSWLLFSMTSFCENLQKHSDGSFLPINAEISQVNCTCLCRSALNRKKPPGFCAVMFGRQTLSKEVMRKRRVWIGRSVVKALKPPSEPHRIFSWPGRSRVCIVTLQSPATKDDEKLVAAGFGAVKLESCSLIFSVFWDLTFPSKSQLHGTRQKNVCTCQKRRVVYEQQGLYEAVLHHCQSLQGPGVMSF